MNGLQEMVFLNDLVLQAKIVKLAGNRLPKTNSNFDQVEVWSSIQSILVATANISKILWPSGKKNAERGEHLRKLLKIESDNILKDRKFRNHFEHYDSRIEEWLDKYPSNVYCDMSMNPIMPGQYFKTFTHRGYITYNRSVVFRDEILELEPILNAIDELLNSCKPHTIV